MEPKLLKTNLANISSESFNSEDKSIELNYYTGTQVLRGGFFEEPYMVEFSQEKGSVVLDRVKNGTAPFLLNHIRSVENTLGKVVKADETKATVKFSSRAEFQGIIKDIEDGILSGVSMGVIVLDYEDITPKNADMKVLRATKWELQEISLVATPADPKAQILENFVEEGTQKSKVVHNKKQENLQMDPDEKKKLEAKAKEAQELAAKEAKLAEKQRTEYILSATEKAGLDKSHALKAIEDDVSMDSYKDIIIDLMAKQQEETHVSTITVGATDMDKKLEGMKEVLSVRMSGQGSLNSGNPYNNETLHGMARETLRVSGRSAAEVAIMSPEVAVAEALATTSDFKNILVDVSNKTLQAAYEEAPKTYRRWAKRNSSKDFKAINSVRLGAIGNLQKVLESGEIPYASPKDNKETYKLNTYGLIVPLSRQAIINDDLGAFGRIATELAKAAARTENKIVYDLLQANPTLSDGVALFHADHGNLTNAKLLNSSTGLDVSATLLKKQTGLAGEKLNLRPNFILVGADTYYAAWRELKDVLANAQDKTNPHTGYELIEDSELNGVPYYVGDKNAAPIEFAFLNGQEGVQFSQAVEFDTDGVKFKALHDFGAGAVDSRGMVKSTNDAT